MRISRKKRPKHEQKVRYRFNQQIRVPVIRLIGLDGEHVGEMATEQAMTMAKEQGLDLVEINPKSRPPICKIVEYGQFKYQIEKEERQKRANQKAVEVKGIRISARIGEGDKEIRRKQALKFFKQGNKVKIELILRGRENAQRDRAAEIVRSFIESLRELADVNVEQDVKRQGNKFTALLAGKIKENPEDHAGDNSEV